MDVFSAVVDSARPHLRDAAVRASSTLGIFAALAETSRTSEELGHALDLHRAHRLDALLEVLSLEGILERTASTSSGAARFRLRGRAPTIPALPALGWGRLAEVIRADEPLPEPGVRGVRETDLPGKPDALERFHAHLCSAGAEAARELMSPLAETEGGVLLDLGSGAGAYSRAWLEAGDLTRAVLVDRPAVLELAQSALGKFASRIELHSLELLEPSRDRSPRAQVVLLANLLHLFGSEEAQTLVARAAASAIPGGLVVIEDLLLDGEPPGPPSGLLFSLNMALFTERGRVHRRDALIGFLQRAGLIDLESRRLSVAPDAVVVQGRRPLTEPTTETSTETGKR